jgi:CheY-like chemotaxis protein
MLAGRTALIVESEIIIALSMQAVLENLGASQVIVMTSPGEFQSRQHATRDAALAIVEIEARRPDQFDLVRSLLDMGIPVLGLTADSRLRNGMPELADMPFLIKPVPDEALAEAVSALLQRPVLQNE